MLRRWIPPRAYATCGPKTLTRGLNELVALGLIVERDGGFANDDVLLTLLPLVVPEGVEADVLATEP